MTLRPMPAHMKTKNHNSYGTNFSRGQLTIFINASFLSAKGVINTSSEDTTLALELTHAHAMSLCLPSGLCD